MSRLELTCCDGCGAAAPDRHSSIFPSPGWSTFTYKPNAVEYQISGDVCSLVCFEMVASRMLAERGSQKIGRATTRRQAAPKGLPAAKAKQLKKATDQIADKLDAIEAKLTPETDQ